MVTHCEFRKLGSRSPHARKYVGVLDLCEVNGLGCLVDDGDPSGCMRYAWAKQVQSKTAKIAQLEQELKVLGTIPQLPLFPELPDGEGVAVNTREEAI